MNFNEISETIQYSNVFSNYFLQYSSFTNFLDAILFLCTKNSIVIRMKFNKSLYIWSTMAFLITLYNSDAFQVLGIDCYQCTSANEWKCMDSELVVNSLELKSCDYVFEAQYCVKTTGRYGGVWKLRK